MQHAKSCLPHAGQKPSLNFHAQHVPPQAEEAEEDEEEEEEEEEEEPQAEEAEEDDEEEEEEEEERCADDDDDDDFPGRCALNRSFKAEDATLSTPAASAAAGMGLAIVARREEAAEGRGEHLPASRVLLVALSLNVSDFPFPLVNKPFRN